MSDKVYELVGNIIEKSMLGLIVIAILALIWYIVIAHGAAIVQGWTRVSEAFHKLPTTIENFEHTIDRFSLALNRVIDDSKQLGTIIEQNNEVLKRNDEILKQLNSIGKAVDLIVSSRR